MKIAITGGAGFFGSHVVKQLIKNGHFCFIIDDLSRGELQNLESINKQKLSFTRADFADPRRALEWTDLIARVKVDVLLHMASPMSHNPIDHIAGLELAASYLRCIKTLRIPTVYISSSSANTDPTTRGLRNQTFQPEGLYGMTKMFMEWALYDLKKAGIVPNFVTLRPSNLYGPFEVFSGHSHIHVIPNLIRKALLSKGPIEVLGDGSQSRPFTYVDDGAAAVLNAIKIVLRGKTIEMALIHGPQVSIREVVNYIVQEAGSKTKVVWKKGTHIGVSSRKLPHHDGKLLNNWKPKISIKEGIKKTVAFAKANPDRLTMQSLDDRPLGSTLA